MSAKEEETLEQGLAGETTPLLGGGGKGEGEGRSPDVPATTATATATATTTTASPSQLKVWEFLEAQTPAGATYESFMVVLILANVVSVILGSLFAEPYNATLGYSWALRDSPDALCGSTCDALWFGNYSEGNPLSVLGLGATSLLELVTIAVFTIEYGLRVWTSSPLEGYSSPLAYVLTDFFSWVDLAATLPFYVDAFVLRDRKTALGTTGFVRMFRLFRMMRVEGGRYDSALGLCGAVYRAQKAVLGTAAFVGATTWISVSSLYYLVERENPSMIYCRAGLCSELNADFDGNVDTSLCTMDEWGLVDCANAGCPSTEDVPEPCYNLFQSIPMASYYALLNLFGEFPLFDQHSVGGQVVGTLTAVVAVTVFALPVGIIGNGFESEIERRRQRQTESDRPIVERGVTTPGYVPPAAGSGWLRDAYLFFFSTSASASRASVFFDYFVDALIIGTALTFAIDTIDDLPDGVRLCQSWFEFFAVVVFTVEYVSRFYVAIRVDPLYNNNSNSNNGDNGDNDNDNDNDASLQSKLWSYATGFVPLVDLLGFLPYWIALLFGGTIVDASGPSGPFDTFVKALRLLRIFHFEKYTHAFTSFDDIFSRNYDVLAITFFSSILLWVLFGALLYMTERDNPDPEMAANYNSIPNSMWMTLLNLSGEAPLAQYSLVGKIATGFLGLFATAIFGIPIGVLGGGFEAVVEDETNDDDRETAEAEAEEAAAPSGASSASASASSQSPDPFGTDLERICYDLVNGQGSEAAKTIETLIYVLIFVAIGIGAWQTVDGHEDDFSNFEAFTVVAFTLEYLVRLVGVGADPVFAGTDDACPIRSRLRYLVSFYSIIDLLAILPYYLALALPDSTVDEYDEYLRMARICRLLKLDKYIPSFTLIDDVIRYKWDSLKVAGYAAITLWTIFAGLIYLFEYTDSTNAIDPVPLYAKCGEDCSMMDRFRNYFDGFYYTGIHLTGDYPITTYGWPGRFVNFFMVVAAVGVVSIPSGLIANGFVDIVQSKHKAEKKKKKKDLLLNNNSNNNKEIVASDAADSEAVEGDDWYEVQYRALEGVAPPTSTWGPTVDQWQCDVNAFLNGTKDARGHTCHTRFGFAGRVFIFSVIIANIVAVMVESVPWIDKAVGDQPGNAFDVFERFSIFVFTLEYLARLFCAAKNRESLYSSKVYAYTFFGIVDLLSTAPWYIEQILVATGTMSAGGDIGKVFRIFRIVRLLQLEDFITAFSKLDNVFRASADILKSCFLLALIIWIGGGSLFFIFEQNNPNFRQCDDSIPPFTEYNNDTEMVVPGCFDFPSTAACAAYYGPGMCEQTVFVNLPNTLYMTAVFLGGEWGVTDFTWPGRILCILFCYVGIALYAIPAGTFFDKFGSILGLDGEDDDEDEDEEE